MIWEMSMVDMIQNVCAIVSILFSIISIVQAGKANKIARESNVTAEIALKDSQKDYMPLIRFADEVKFTSKSIGTLRSEVTFDFDGWLITRFNINGNEYDENDELFCVTAKLENCGEGIIKGVKIDDFFIQSGNRVAIRSDSDEELETLCFIKPECKEWFVLLPEETITVNFLITQNVMDREEFAEVEEAHLHIQEFGQNNHNIMIGMDLELESVNNTCYKQDFLAGTYLDGKVVHNSFVDVKCR